VHCIGVASNGTLASSVAASAPEEEELDEHAANTVAEANVHAPKKARDVRAMFAIVMPWTVSSNEMRHLVKLAVFGALAAAASSSACGHAGPGEPESPHANGDFDASAAATFDAAADIGEATDDGRANAAAIADLLTLDASDVDASAAPIAVELDASFTDPMALHKDSRDALLSLFSLRDMNDRERQRSQSDLFLRTVFGTDGPEHASQGNKAIALHTISREKCLEGLAGVVLQTPAQREQCGADNMVPFWSKGEKALACIDVFEFPNKACELPVVWMNPTNANAMCRLQGKRLCTDKEWSLACRGDPDGGPDRRYAYGDTLDLDVCNTHKTHRQHCVSRDAKTTWATCTTDSEPSGAFPRCRSRFGVFDQHGNVAEIMTRKDTDGTKVSQLKGSAWFYSELAREPDKPIPASTPFKDMAHPDHCNFDPRWHVENMDAALHVNYHLGFRCCKSL
jgi:hypothetical protein